jgi:excisionase family DNA binding protein
MNTYGTRLCIRYDVTMTDNEVIQRALNELAEVKTRLAVIEAQGGPAEWMDKAQLCRWLGFKNIRTADRLMARRKIPFVKIGKSVRFHRADVLARLR